MDSTIVCLWKVIICRQRVSESVKVAKLGDFTHFGGCILETKTGRKSRFAPFDRSHQDISARHFFYDNQPVNMDAIA